MKEIQQHPRTLQQNRAMHLYFTLVANALNEAGLTIEEVLKNFTIELDWNAEMVKSILWKTAQKRLLHKNSTTELNKQKDIDEVYNAVNRFLAKLGIESIPFPSCCDLCGGIEKHEIGCPNIGKF